MIQDRESVSSNPIHTEHIIHDKTVGSVPLTSNHQTIPDISEDWISQTAKLIKNLVNESPLPTTNNEQATPSNQNHQNPLTLDIPWWQLAPTRLNTLSSLCKLSIHNLIIHHNSHQKEIENIKLKTEQLDSSIYDTYDFIDNGLPSLVQRIMREDMASAIISKIVEHKLVTETTLSSEYVSVAQFNQLSTALDHLTKLVHNLNLKVDELSNPNANKILMTETNTKKEATPLAKSLSTNSPAPFSNPVDHVENKKIFATDSNRYNGHLSNKSLINEDLTVHLTPDNGEERAESPDINQLLQNHLALFNPQEIFNNTNHKKAQQISMTRPDMKPLLSGQNTQILHSSLMKTKDYFHGSLKHHYPSPSVDDRDQITGDSINLILTSLFHNSVDVIHPNSLSMNSLFSHDEPTQTEGIFDFLEYLHGLHALGGKDYSADPPSLFDKPVVAIINTQGVDQSQIDPHTTYGAHWLSFVLLPKGYQGMLYRNHNQDPNTEPNKAGETVYLFDSLASNRNLPRLLQDSLIYGANRTQEIDGLGKRLQRLPSLVTEQVTFVANTSRALQTYDDNNCALWALFNTVMTIIEGNDNFYMDFQSPANEESQQQAGVYLRKLFNAIAASNSIDGSPKISSLRGEINGSPFSSSPSPPSKKKVEGIHKSAAVSGRSLKADGTPDMRLTINKKSSNKSSKKRRSDNTSCEESEDSLASQFRPPQKQIKLTSTDQELYQSYEAIKIELQLSLQNLNSKLNRIEDENNLLKKNLEEQKLRPEPIEPDNSRISDIQNNITELQGTLSPLLNHFSQQIEEVFSRIKQLEDHCNRLSHQVLGNKAETQTNQPQLKTAIGGLTNKGIQQNTIPHGHKIKISPNKDYTEQEMPQERMEVELLGRKNRSDNMRVQTIPSPSSKVLNRITSQEQTFTSKDNFGREKVSHAVMEEEPINSRTQYSTIRHNHRVSLSKSNPKPQLVISSIQSQTHQQPKPAQVKKALTIPWKGKILTPTYNDLRKHKGNLEAIEQALGSKTPNTHEKQFTHIRIYWRKQILWPTQEELEQTEGNLDELAKLPSITIKPERCFRQDEKIKHQL